MFLPRTWNRCYKSINNLTHTLALNIQNLFKCCKITLFSVLYNSNKANILNSKPIHIYQNLLKFERITDIINVTWRKDLEMFNGSTNNVSQRNKRNKFEWRIIYSFQTSIPFPILFFGNFIQRIKQHISALAKIVYWKSFEYILASSCWPWEKYKNNKK